MKKLALIALLLLTAPVAEARQVTTDLLVVKLKSQKAAGVSAGASDVDQGQWVHEQVRAILDEWRVDYRVMDASSLPTGKNEWLRTGRVVLGPDTITASAVLHERSSRRSAATDYPAYRPDSMFMTRIVNGTPTLPSVPQLFLLEPGPTLGYVDIAAVAWHTTSACSIGVTTNASPITAGSGIPHECEGCFYSPGVDRVFFPQSAATAAELNLSTVGGVLPLLATYTNALPVAVQELGRMPADLMRGRSSTTYAAADTAGEFGSTMVPHKHATPDTASVWKRLNIGWNVHDHSGDTVAAAQMIFANSAVTIGVDDGSAISRNGDAFEYASLFVALAALDSLMDGGLIGGADPFNWRPKVMAVTIDGAFARCDQQYSQGVYLPDSAAVKATVDSLAAYGIPFLVGVNVDSVAAYPYEKAWWAKGGARFTPQVWSGVNGANGAASYAAGRYTLRDLFGHARQRQAYGPADGAANDTSFYSQLKFAFARNDSLFPGRSSRFLLPPLDDFVPTNSIKGDSILIAAWLAGASGIRISAQDTLRRAYQTTNVQQRGYRGLKLLGHTGEYVTGGSRLIAVPGGTYAVGYFVTDSGYAYQPFCTIAERQLSGIVRGVWRGTEVTHPTSGSSFRTQFQTYGSSTQPNLLVTKVADGCDANLYHNGWGLASRASILKVAASALGGSTYISDLRQPGRWGETGNPTRPGWWAIRATDGFRAVVNAVAGRTLIRWGYPEDIDP